MTGSRGPLPRPAALKLLEGNPGKRALNLGDGVNPRIEIPSAPKHLGQEARKEWKRITPLLSELGLVSGLVGGYDDNADALNISYLSNKGAVDYGSDPVIANLYPNAGGWYSSGTTSNNAGFGSGLFAATRPRNIALLACIKY